MTRQHGDFQNKMTVEAHMPNYLYPPTQFHICTEMTHTTRPTGRILSALETSQGQKSPSGLSPNQYMQNPTGKGRAA